MNNVLLYARVSSDEQASKGYSLRDQEHKLIKYCELHNLNIIGIYREDHSAKTFNRPEFKKLLIQSKREKENIDLILFTKWDRFSRNTTESYNKIDRFQELGILVDAIEQSLDLSIPEQRIMLAVYLSMPEVENHRRSLNIIAGTRRAYKEGRYVASPPKGYDMGRDSNKKPIITPNGDANYIQEAFQLLATGLYTQREVLDKLRSKGFKTSKSAFARIIRNSIYYGEFYLKAYKDEPEMKIKGVHEPIITKMLFDKVQCIIDGRKQQAGISHKKLNDKFPLKGFVLCPSCFKPLLASSSKGRNKYYSYYHCTKPCNTRYKIEDVESWFNSFLSGISLNRPVEHLLYKMIEEKINLQSESSNLGPAHYMAIEKLKNKLIRIQDLYIEGDLSKKDYEHAKSRYNKELQFLEEKEVNLKKKKEVLKVYKNGLNKLNKFDKVFDHADLEHKRKLIGSIFPEKFQFQDDSVRTSDINPLLIKIASINGAYRRNKKRDKSKNIDLSRNVLKVGTETIIFDTFQNPLKFHKRTIKSI